MTEVNLLLTCFTVMLLFLCILSIPQSTIKDEKSCGEVLFGDTFDIWRIAKVPEREAAQVIRRAARLGYKEIQHLYDEAGSVYIHFQLCPPRKI